MIDLETPRQFLKATLEAEGIAKSKLQQAQEAVQRAEQIVTEAKEAMKAFDAAEQQIQEFRSEKLREWAANGGERPSLTLPPALDQARAGRGAAETEMVTAQAVAEGLRADLAVVQDAAAKATQATRRAVQSLASAQALNMLEEAQDLEARARELRRQLSGLPAALMASTPVRDLQNGNLAPSAVITFLTEPPPYPTYGREIGPDLFARNAAQADWSNLLALLPADPAAMFKAETAPIVPPPPPQEPRWEDQGRRGELVGTAALR